MRDIDDIRDIYDTLPNANKASFKEIIAQIAIKNFTEHPEIAKISLWKENKSPKLEEIRDFMLSLDSSGSGFFSRKNDSTSKNSLIKMGLNTKNLNDDFELIISLLNLKSEPTVDHSLKLC